MEARQCAATLSLRETQTLAREPELRLYACAVCGRENLYPVRSPSGDWALEPHDVLAPRFDREAAFLLGE